MIDSHAHLTGEDVFPRVDQIIARAKAAGVSHIINICTDLDSLLRGDALHLHNAGATTPHDVHLFGAAHFPTFETFARQKKLVAVGETGLDYYYWKETKELQIHFFRKYIHLAEECNLPLIIHCRDAFSDLFSILDEEQCKIPTILHCFTGTMEEAKEAIQRGLTLSLVEL